MVAEICSEYPYQIEESLAAVVCRNPIEKITLLNLLHDEDMRTYTRYKNRIDCGWQNLFYNNGLFVEDCNFNDHTAVITFSNTYEKKRYIQTYVDRQNADALRRLKGNAVFEWAATRSRILDRGDFGFEIDYVNPSPIRFTGLVPPKGARALYVRVFIENSLMCYGGWQVEAAML